MDQTGKADAHLKSLEANMDKLMDLAQHVEECPKKKGEEGRRATAKEIQTGKLREEKLAREPMHSRIWR
jgi:hypothetical protein